MTVHRETWHWEKLPDWWIEKFHNTYIEFSPIRDRTEMTVFMMVGGRRFRMDGIVYENNGEPDWGKTAFYLLEELIDMSRPESAPVPGYGHLVWDGIYG